MVVTHVMRFNHYTKLSSMRRTDRKTVLISPDHAISVSDSEVLKMSGTVGCHGKCRFQVTPQPPTPHPLTDLCYYLSKGELRPDRDLFLRKSTTKHRFCGPHLVTSLPQILFSGAIFYRFLRLSIRRAQ